MEKLGNLFSIDVRSIWPNEAADFTPWLAREDNVSRLGAAIGLELEVEHTEVAAGSYSADIVARDSGTGSYVVIENQLSKTDHDHLGKALTYAAILGARTIVWIAATFTDEHRKVLDWLNGNTPNELAFYGVQLELWSIDGSAPAVRFNVVCRPAELARQVIAASTRDLSESRRLQLEWWTAVREALLAKRAVPSAQSPRPQYWYNVALGRTGIHLSLTANTFDSRLAVRVYMLNRYGGGLALQQLLLDREAIESEIGEALDWDPNPGATDKTIVLSRDADLSRRDRWPEYLDWLVDKTVRFRKAFVPRVRLLELIEPPGIEGPALEQGPPESEA